MIRVFTNPAERARLLPAPRLGRLQGLALRAAQPVADKAAVVRLLAGDFVRERGLREVHAPGVRQVQGPDRRRPGGRGREGDCGAQAVNQRS